MPIVLAAPLQVDGAWSLGIIAVLAFNYHVLAPRRESRELQAKLARDRAAAEGRRILDDQASGHSTPRSGPSTAPDPSGASHGYRNAKPSVDIPMGTALRSPRTLPGPARRGAIGIRPNQPIRSTASLFGE